MPHFDVERRIESIQIRNRIAEIEQTIYSQRQPIGNLECCVTGTGKGPERAPETGWKPFKVLGMWGGLDQTTWFRMTATIPASMKGQRVVALVRTAQASFVPDNPDLNEGGEALAYVNGAPFQGLDRNRDELYLAEKARGGEAFEIVLETCPSTRYDLRHVFAYADIAVMNPQVWDFYWDCTVVFEVWEQLDQNTARARHLMALLDECVRSVDLQHTGEASYFDSIAHAQRTLRRGLRAFSADTDMGKLVLAGHAHIDTAWLWPLRETQRKCARTFSTILNLMDRYPEFYFSCSQPIQYEWIKTHYPELYVRIKERVKEGRWELCGAPWCEPDHNVPSGESMVRQYLYGNRFYEREFGKRSKIVWVPDSFGYMWSLPQIIKKAGLNAFVTTKIDWSKMTQFPYSMFEWEGSDGSRVFALMPPLNYNGNPVPEKCIKQWRLFKQKELVDELPYAFGWGDGGGGPTMSMIEHGKRMKDITGVPQCEFGRISDCVERMRQKTRDKTLPVYNGELYLELHRGCQTTQARTKRNNRKCEVLLRDAELLSVLAVMNGGKYDHVKLWNAWKPVLTNQFHDILPGSSINEVYTQADTDYAEARKEGEDVRDTAAASVMRGIDTSGEGAPIVVFNTLGWVRTDVANVKAALPESDFAVLNPAGIATPHQIAEDGSLLFEANGVPPLGYATHRIVPGRVPAQPSHFLKASTAGMENQFLRIRFDKRGCLTSIYDQIERREVLSKGQRGNVLQLFDDRPWLHDAWDIDHNFEANMWEPKTTERMEVVESGPVRAVVRVVRKTEKSTFTQDVTMYAGSPRVDFVTRVDWHEKRTLLKVAFPVDVRAQRATFEIQYAAIERNTHNNWPQDCARFEVPAYRWADLSEGDFGVTLLNDCKYGYDVKGNVLRLSLLRSSVDPDPHADEGYHEFTYSIYSHAWGWRNGAVRQGYELNVPLHAVQAPKSKGPFPSVDAFASIDVENVVIDAVKKHEDSDAIIVRLYEAHGQRGDVTLTFGRRPKKVTECDLMEENDVSVKPSGNNVRFFIKPFEIRTFKVVFA